MLTFPVSAPKIANLRERMTKLGLREEDLEEGYFKASGPGGQKTNKTLTGVTILHLPTGVRVRCQRERSQGINRFLARRLLVEELEARLENKTRQQVKAEKLHEEKMRRRKRRGPGEKPQPCTIEEMRTQFLLRPVSESGSAIKIPPPPASPQSGAE